MSYRLEVGRDWVRAPCGCQWVPVPGGVLRAERGADNSFAMEIASLSGKMVSR
jgi:hypothetical protein